MSQKVNLKAYFERIGFSGSIAPTAATLEALHALHPAAIPFENLDPLLGRPISLDYPAIERKLLSERRGGYCYEHNLLLMAMLRELDYTVKGLAAKVLWSNPEATDVAPHHMLLAVEIGGTTYIADVGFGGLSLTAPLKLRAEVEQKTPHETFRLLGGDPIWRLEAKVGEDWRVLYTFDMAEKTLEHYGPSNTWLSSDPTSPFTSELRVALSPPGKRLALKDNRFTIYTVGEPPETRELTTLEEMREVLSTTFGITLPQAELLDPALERVLTKLQPAAG